MNEDRGAAIGSIAGDPGPDVVQKRIDRLLAADDIEGKVGAATGELSAGESPPRPPSSAEPNGISDTASASSDTATAAARRPPRSIRARLVPFLGSPPSVSERSGRPAPRRTSAARRRRTR